MAPITKPFLLCVCVPVWIDDRGRRWTDEFWAKDLALHLDYLADLTIVCPSLERAPGAHDVCVSDPPFDRIKFVDLPFPRSYAEAVWTFPRYLARLWSATRRASIVQSGFGGWPVAAGWFLAPMGKFQKQARRHERGILFLAKPRGERGTGRAPHCLRDGQADASCRQDRRLAALHIECVRGRFSWRARRAVVRRPGHVDRRGLDSDR